MRKTLYSAHVALLAAFVVAGSATVAADGESDFEGSVEVLVRNVSQNGSVAKFEEDFDGLDSGVRLSSAALNWSNISSEALDYLRFEANGLGGDPYEGTYFRIGRKDVYDFSIRYRKQTYLYNLFEVENDLDGSTWDAERRMTDIDLTFHATDRIDVFVEYQGVERSGTSLFMKDIRTDLFRLETPLDQQVKRYSVGGRFELGKVNLLFRQTLRRYDYQFNNSTMNNTGLLTTDLVTLNEYNWVQSDTGDGDLTTLTVSTPLGRRVQLTATAFGTLLGDQQISSHVSLNSSGTSFRGACSVTGAFCDSRNPCDLSVAGNVCVADPYEVTDGTSTAEIGTDFFVVEADLSVSIVESLDFHFLVRTMDQETTAEQLRDLDGNGVPDDMEGIVNDDTPGSRTSVDYSHDSITGLFDWVPSSAVRFRAGYRTIDRKLTRDGSEYSPTDYRNTDFESDGDDTVVLGMLIKPVRWFRFDADYEKGDITQAFTAVAPMEIDRLRARAKFEPRPQIRIDLGYLDYKNVNRGTDFRQKGDCNAPGSNISDGCWNTNIDGTQSSVLFWHKPTPKLDYWLRWAKQDVNSLVAVRFDTNLFGIAENGFSSFDNTSTEWGGQVNFRWSSPWSGFVLFRINDSDGNNVLAGSTYTNDIVIAQDFSDVEAGVTYTFPSRLYVGGRYRIFDYDDVNNRLDYDGEILTVVAGLNF